MANKEFLTYKGYPLVRSGRIIHYGNSYDPFIIMIQIASFRKVGDVDIADKVLIQLLNTDPNIPPSEMIVKRSEKKGLWDAIELASIWLDNVNKKSQ